MQTKNRRSDNLILLDIESFVYKWAKPNDFLPVSILARLMLVHISSNLPSNAIEISQTSKQLI
jgi:hypothetical protein